MTSNPNEDPMTALARIEAIGRLATRPPTCEHCTPRLEPLMAEGDTLPNAFGICHEDDCVTHVEFELEPAAEMGEDELFDLYRRNLNQE